MDRFLTVAVVAALHLVAAAAALLCYGPACAWADGGGWLSPAVRVPLVFLGVLLLELAALALVWPCNHLTRRVLGRRG